MKSWQGRLAEALEKLEIAQRPYLERHWQVRGYPPTIHFNDEDVTPYPRDDVLELYDTVLRAKSHREVAYFNDLRSALDPVRGVLRSHPALQRALGHLAGQDKFLIEIANGTSLTWLTVLVVGLMERAREQAEKGFEQAATELGLLLNKSIASSHRSDPLELSLGYDVLLFFGPQIDRQIDIGPDLIVMPFAAVQDWVDSEWIRDFVPEQVDRRDWRQIGAIVRPFDWKPYLHRMNCPRERPIEKRPNFEQDAMSFLELLAISNQTPFIPFAFIDDCIHRAALLLLGKFRNSGGTQRVGIVGRRHDPFRSPPRLHQNSVRQALGAFDLRHSPSFERLAPVRRRLSESLARDGRFVLDDRILDVSQSIELMFEIKGTKIGKQIQLAMSDLLASDEVHGQEIRKATKKFYDVRSAIVHGPSDEHRKRLMHDRVRVFRSGFNLAQQAYFKLLLEE
ncbi:hypothetical protein WG622_11705 [Cognatishimia sp. D5M38]|uniref:Apea-like HEPN domain-containing protein n=1 Tax=Cognatishimia coralii TaxID=3083254 RepID=A0ABU8QHM7_9RHOB